MNTKEYGKEYYLKNKEKIKEYTKKYKINNKDKVKQHKRNYYQNNKDRLRKKFYARMIAKKKIKLVGLCQDCKVMKAVERHHPDYNKPLEVELLCSSCHKKK